MKRTPRWYFIGLLISPLVLFGWYIAKRRFPSFGYAFVVCVSVSVLISLPSIFLQAREEAVPAKGSDIIGYFLICAALLIVAGIAYSVLK